MKFGQNMGMDDPNVDFEDQDHYFKGIQKQLIFNIGEWLLNEWVCSMHMTNTHTL